MLNNLGIVDACFESPRRRAMAARRLGGKPILEWVVRRVTDSQQLDGVIVLCGGDPENQFVNNLVPLDVPVFIGRQTDALGCFAQALERYPARSVVRVRVEHPFVDPVLVDRLVTTAGAHSGYDYVGYCSRDGRPAILSPVGVYAEWFRGAALRRVDRLARSVADRVNVTQYLYSHPEKFTIRLIPAPARIDRDDIRLSIDIEEDWDHALAIFDALGPEELDLQRIADLLDHQPALRKRMAALNRVHAKG